MFLGFANFYQQFIQGFSRIAAPLILMLKISRSTESKTRHGDGGVGVSGSRTRQDGSGFDRNRICSGEVGDDEVGKKV